MNIIDVLIILLRICIIGLFGCLLFLILTQNTSTYQSEIPSKYFINNLSINFSK
jgi:hypothetical protein